MALTYTNIQHQFRKENNLSVVEYCLTDMIYHLSTSPRSSVPGWCYMSRHSISLELGLTRRAIFIIIDRLIDGGFLEKDNDTKFLRTTPEWYKVYSYNAGEKSSPVVKKVHQGGEKSSPVGGEKSSPVGGEKSSPYNNTLNNNTLDKNKENIYTGFLSNSFEVFTREGASGVFFEKMKKIHSLNDPAINEAFEKWFEKNDSIGTEFKDEKHLKASFNVFLQNFKYSNKTEEMTIDEMVEASNKLNPKKYGRNRS